MMLQYSFVFAFVFLNAVTGFEKRFVLLRPRWCRYLWSKEDLQKVFDLLKASAEVKQFIIKNLFEKKEMEKEKEIEIARKEKGK
jgi:hypothetical protein